MHLDLWTDGAIAAHRPEDDGLGLLVNVRDEPGRWVTHVVLDLTVSEQFAIENASDLRAKVGDYLVRMIRAAILHEGPSGTIGGWDLAKGPAMTEDEKKAYKREMCKETRNKPKTCECDMRLLAQGHPHEATCTKL